MSCMLTVTVLNPYRIKIREPSLMSFMGNINQNMELNSGHLQRDF